MNTRSSGAVTPGASVDISPSFSKLLETAAQIATGASAVPRRTCIETLNLDAFRDCCYWHRGLCRQIARGRARHFVRTFTRTIGTQPRAWARAANPQVGAFAQLTTLSAGDSRPKRCSSALGIG